MSDGMRQFQRPVRTIRDREAEYFDRGSVESDPVLRERFVQEKEREVHHLLGFDRGETRSTFLTIGPRGTKRRVRNCATQHEFNSISDAAASIDLSAKAVYIALQMGTRAGGAHWEYVE